MGYELSIGTSMLQADRHYENLYIDLSVYVKALLVVSIETVI